MANRTVVVASPSSNVAKKIENFTGTTFADLKRNSVFSGLYAAGVDVILNPGNVTLTRDDAELPNEDFRVFLIPSKNKSGGTDAETLGQQISAAIMKAADLASAKDLTELKDSLIYEIESFYDVDLSSELGEGCGECSEALADAKRMVG